MVGVVGFEPTAFLMYLFYRQAPIRPTEQYTHVIVKSYLLWYKETLRKETDSTFSTYSVTYKPYPGGAWEIRTPLLLVLFQVLQAIEPKNAPSLDSVVFIFKIKFCLVAARVYGSG